MAKKQDTINDRVAHLENEVLRELGEIGDIARQFISLKKLVSSELVKMKKDIDKLKRRVNTIRRKP